MSTLNASANAPVSPLIPFSAIGVFSGAQLWLGTSPSIVAMCAAAIALPFLMLAIYGRDLYGLLGIAFCLKYVGIALVAKTFYGQTLESNLNDPYGAFSLTLLIIFVYTVVIFVARALDRGKSLFPLPMDLVNLRRLSFICIFIGILGDLAYSTRVTDTEAFSAAGAGPIVVLGGIFRPFFVFGVIAESVYAVIKTGGRSFVSRRVVVLLLIQALFSIAFNERGELVNSVIAIVSIAFLYDALRIRHAFIGLILGSFFISVFTPITMYLRFERKGLSFPAFVELAGNTFVRAATDPDFFKLVSQTQKNIFYQFQMVPYDYYGLRSEVLDRLSFISLVDAVYTATRSHAPAGKDLLQESLIRAAPSFLGYSRESTTYGLGDWLSWRTGLADAGDRSFLVFGLPMEGLAAWGFTGLITYPFIFVLPLLYLSARLSSFRLPLAASIFLFLEAQEMIVDGASDIFISWLTRDLPLMFLTLFALNHMLRPPSLQPKALKLMP